MELASPYDFALVVVVLLVGAFSWRRLRLRAFDGVFGGRSTTKSANEKPATGRRGSLSERISLQDGGDMTSTMRLRSDPRFKADALAQLRRRVVTELPTEISTKLSELDILRFVVARSGCVDAAFTQLVAASAYLDELMASPLTCSRCEQAPRSHSFVPLGVEGTERSSIIYGCPARATERNVDETARHVAMQLEYIFRTPETGSRFVWVVDYNGFGSSHAMQLRLAARFATLFTAHLPERMHKIIMVNPPNVFQVMLDFIRPMLDPVILAKLVPVCGSATFIMAQLETKHAFPRDAIQWLGAVFPSPPTALLPPLPESAYSLLLPGLRTAYACGQPRLPHSKPSHTGASERQNCCHNGIRHFCGGRIQGS